MLVLLSALLLKETGDENHVDDVWYAFINFGEWWNSVKLSIVVGVGMISLTFGNAIQNVKIPAKFWTKNLKFTANVAFISALASGVVGGTRWNVAVLSMQWGNVLQIS